MLLLNGINANGYLFYRPKDCLIPDTAVLTEVQWEEWNYTTASGAEVLIVRSEEASSAWIFSDMENHTASVRLDAVQKVYDFLWDTYCDWYIELTKARLYSEDAEQKAAES